MDKPTRYYVALVLFKQEGFDDDLEVKREMLATEVTTCPTANKALAEELFGYVLMAAIQVDRWVAAIRKAR